MDTNIGKQYTTSDFRRHFIRGITEVVVGALIFWLSIVWLDSLGWGALAFGFIIILGPVGIGLGALDIIIGLARKKPGWGTLLTLRVLVIILSVSWFFIGNQP